MEGPKELGRWFIFPFILLGMLFTFIAVWLWPKKSLELRYQGGR